MKWLSKNKETVAQYDTIVIDNISELFRSMLANLGRNGKNERVPEMSHYQRVDFFTIDSLRFLQSLGKRLVFIAWKQTSNLIHQQDNKLRKQFQIFVKQFVTMLQVFAKWLLD